MRVPPGVGRWSLRGLLLFVLAFANLNDIWSPDVVPNALLAWTIVREGDVDYDEFVGPAPLGLDREAYFFRACGSSTATAPPASPRSAGGPPAPGPGDRVCSIFPPGIGLLALPLFLPFTGAEPDLATLVRVGHAAAAVVEVVATLLLWAVLLRFTRPGWAVALVLLYYLGTSVRTVSSQALWQHAGVHLAVAAALWLVLREASVPRARETAAGVLLGLGALVRQTTALASLGIAGASWRRIPFAVGGAALGLLPLLAWNAVAFGNPLEQGYGAKPFDAPLVAGLHGLLLSPSRGLLVYTPHALFGLAALALAWRRSGPVAQRLRGLSVVWIATLLLYATYAEWWGGRVFGPRFLDDLAPVLFAALGWGIGQGLLRARAARLGFAASALWSLLLFNAAALAYSNERWDMHPANVNTAPERLFDWSDPQWLAVLGDAASGGSRVLVGAALTSLLVLAMLLSERVLASARDGFRPVLRAERPERGRAAPR